MSLWFTSGILSDPAHEIDRMVVDRIARETSERPLSEILSELGDEQREDAGEFGLGQEAFLLASLLIPAVQGLIQTFASKFLEGAASTSGKLAVESLKGRIAKSLAGEIEPELSDKMLSELDAQLARRATELGQPPSSYKEILRHIRANPKILL